MSDLKQRVSHYAHEARRFLALARLTPMQWPVLLLTPALGALVMAAGGLPQPGPAFGMLLMTLSLWGVVWIGHDLLAARRGNESDSLILQGVTRRNEAYLLLALLGVLALVMILLLDRRVLLLVPLVLVVAIGYPWLRRRSYLIDVWFGLGIAWTVPLAFGALGQWPSKSGALLSVVTLLWATGWSVLHHWPQQVALLERGLRTLGQMFGPATGYVVIGLQAMVLTGAWMAGTQAKLGGIYLIALLMALIAMAWESLLIQRKGVAATAPALRLHLLTGVVLWLGVALHFFTTP